MAESIGKIVLEHQTHPLFFAVTAISDIVRVLITRATKANFVTAPLTFVKVGGVKLVSTHPTGLKPFFHFRYAVRAIPGLVERLSDFFYGFTADTALLIFLTHN